MTRPRTLLVAAALLTLTGCGGGSPAASPSRAPSASDSSSPSSSPSASPSASPEAAAPADVVARLKTQDGQWGTPKAGVQTYDLAQYTANDPTALNAATKRGFQLAAGQHLVVPRTNDAIRVVVRYASSAGARAAAEDLPAGTTQFAVTGIPGGLGFDGGQGGEVQGRNVTFPVGRYVYSLGYAVENGGKPAYTQQQLAADAVRWYDAVRSLR